LASAWTAGGGERDPHVRRLDGCDDGRSAGRRQATHGECGTARWRGYLVTDSDAASTSPIRKPERGRARHAEMGKNTGTVFVVDDDASVRQGLTRLLESA